MKENHSVKNLIRLGIISLLVSPLGIFILTQISSHSEFVINLLLILTVIFFALPVLVGIFLVYKFFLNKSVWIIMLAILNFIAPLWLFFLLAALVFQDVKDF